MRIGILKETYPGERRVALTPEVAATLIKKGQAVVVESGAGAEAGFADGAYQAHGAEVRPERASVCAQAEVLLQVRLLGANPQAGQTDLPLMRSEQTLIGFCDPLSNPQAVARLAASGVTSFSMELMPRITRAQSMDALSSMATIAGYKAVLLAADRLPKMFPMMMTAAGTIRPARVFVIGAGVAGLQAIASARRMGAVVSAYDVRPAVKEQIQSLGAKFIEMDLQAGAAEDKGGYAKAMDDTFYRKQRELMTRVVAESDAVICTAAIPGKKAPVLITAEMVDGMPDGSVIVDLAAATGGNCAVTRPDECVRRRWVTVLGPTNLASEVPFHASQMYAKNITTFFLHLLAGGALVLDLEDDITRDTLLTRGGAVVNTRIKELL